MLSFSILAAWFSNSTSKELSDSGPPGRVVIRDLSWRFSIDDSYDQHERGEIPASSYFAALRQSLSIDLSDEDFIERWNSVYPGPVRGMSEVLSVAKRHLPLFAFTNSNPTHQSVWEQLYAAELRLFQTIFVSSDLGARKPEPEAFQLVARRMGFQARGSVVLR
jgi:glucose-1-phosphatase